MRLAHTSLGAIVAFSLTVAPAVAQATCSDAASAADDAYRYSRRAVSTWDIDEARSLIRRARNAAEDAMSEAAACNCGDAESYADDAYTNARRAYNASNLEELHYYADRVRKAASAAESAASSCG